MSAKPVMRRSKKSVSTSKRSYKKKTEREKLEDKAHEWWSLCVRARDKKCLWCGSTNHLSAHHIAKSHLSAVTRYLLLNGISLCSGHHAQEKFRPEYFRENIIRLVGEERYNYLHELAGKSCKRSLEELERVIEELKDKYAEMLVAEDMF